MAGAGGLVSGIGSSKAASSQAAAYNDLAQGDLAAAADYGKAENIAEQNSAIEQENTAVQVYQQQRTVAMTIGTARPPGEYSEAGAPDDALRARIRRSLESHC